ncbi:MAG TPA: sialidase family protein [Opitutaceae bacterium]|nr:sialidase family protein [Opitutaceae bacterium]
MPFLLRCTASVFSLLGLALGAFAQTPAKPAGSIPDRPLSQSPLVIKNAVMGKDGKPIDGVKLSQHDFEIHSPSICVAPNGQIHVTYVEKHRTTYALAVYHRSSSDKGATWTDAKNLSEEMPDIQTGYGVVLADGKDRIYAIWRAGLGVNSPANPYPSSTSHANLVYRVLENGKWSKILPVHPPGSMDLQNDGSLAYFAVVDPQGRVQVIWNTKPGKWHPELTVVSGTYVQHLPGVGNGLVFQATLDGRTASAPREIFLTEVGGIGEGGGYGTHCDGLDTLNGYIDAQGEAHFAARVTRTRDFSLQGKSRFQLFERGKAGPFIDFPDLSYHTWASFPRLLVDAEGRSHFVMLYPKGERPSIRDYLIGSDEEPDVIRQTASEKGTVDSFQAFQGPGGHMIAVYQMNDTGEKGDGNTFVSISTGKGWSEPVNVTNNQGRKSFASTQTSRASHIAVATSYYPGPTAATFDHEGHLLLVMINNEYGLFSSGAFGVTLVGGSSSTPKLQFLRL